MFFSINKGGGGVCLQGRDKIQDIAEEWKTNVFHLNEAVVDFLCQCSRAFVELT